MSSDARSRYVCTEWLEATLLLSTNQRRRENLYMCVRPSLIPAALPPYHLQMKCGLLTTSRTRTSEQHSRQGRKRTGLTIIPYQDLGHPQSQDPSHACFSLSFRVSYALCSSMKICLTRASAVMIKTHMNDPKLYLPTSPLLTFMSDVRVWAFDQR